MRGRRSTVLVAAGSISRGAKGGIVGMAALPSARGVAPVVRVAVHRGVRGGRAEWKIRDIFRWCRMVAITGMVRTADAKGMTILGRVMMEGFWSPGGSRGRAGAVIRARWGVRRVNASRGRAVRRRMLAISRRTVLMGREMIRGLARIL